MSKIWDVSVTSTHTYKIEYKFNLACTNPQCSFVVKIYSRSVDAMRHQCGLCKGKLTETSSINSFFVFSTFFYLSLGRGSIISTPNQLFSTSDLEIFTNRPRDNLANLYPTSHGRFLPNFLQITQTVSRSLSTKLISTPNFTHYLLLLPAIKNKPMKKRPNQKRIEPVVTLQ